MSLVGQIRPTWSALVCLIPPGADIGRWEIRWASHSVLLGRGFAWSVMSRASNSLCSVTRSCTKNATASNSINVTREGAYPAAEPAFQRRISCSGPSVDFARHCWGTCGQTIISGIALSEGRIDGSSKQAFRLESRRSRCAGTNRHSARRCR
jgi:hypothetical protein